MTVGYTGHLVSAAFLETRLHVADAGVHDFRRALQRVRAHAGTLGPASGLRAIVDVVVRPLCELLEWRLAQCAFEPEHAVLLTRAGSAHITIIVTPWASPLDRARQLAMLQARRARADWAAVTNGTHLRVMRPFQISSRRYFDIDLDLAAEDAQSAAALALLCAAAALGSNRGPQSLIGLMAESSRHEAGVTRSLRGGVLEASTEVLTALLARDRARSVDDVFEQSLTIVYRLLFLFFAEARALVPLWNPIYRENYSAEALRELALEGCRVGFWDAVRAMSRLAHSGCHAGDLRVTAFNGRLFSPARTPAAERRSLDDDAARRAVLALSTRTSSDGEGLERLSYRDLGVEQLGAVYESLLDYTPRVDRTPRGHISRVALEPGSGVRKATGTFYTPQPIVDDLVRETLAPLTAGATPERILELRVLDPSMGSGAFVVGACRYLAEAYETALLEHGRCIAADITSAERASIRRVVGERCLFGVDINPTAVQLARLSLWLTTLAADRPLTFLDHHLRVGNSLLGTWLARLLTPPARVRVARALPLFGGEEPGAALRSVLPVRFQLATGPSETASQVRAKERALATLEAEGGPLGTWTRVADVWCSAWLAQPAVPSSAFADLCEVLLNARSSLPPAMADDFLARAATMRDNLHPFHWELEFPEVFFDSSGARAADGGFDAVIGNPPWDMVRADSNSHVSSKAQVAALVRFAREAGTFETTSTGQLNLYQLFVDRSLAITRPGGRIGLVLPAGIVSDAGSAAVRRLLFSRSALERLVGFDNRLGTFPIHRSTRFVLLTTTAGGRTSEIACRFGETDPAVLDSDSHSMTKDPDTVRSIAKPSTERLSRGEPGGPDSGTSSMLHSVEEGPARVSGSPLRGQTMQLTTALIQLVSGDDLSIPYLCTPMDLRILEHAARRFAPLESARGWSVTFGRELNASDDRPLMTRETDGTLPVLEGKHIEPFRCLPSRAEWRIDAAAAERKLGARWKRARLAYRDVASPTNRTTLIAAILPARTVSTHTLFCLKPALPLRSQRLLCGLLNSLVVNFLVRLRVSTHVTTAIVERLPMPVEADFAGMAEDVVDAATRLSDLHDTDAFAHLNALVAMAYGLRLDELDHVLDSFPLIARDERMAVRNAFQQLGCPWF